MIRYLFHAPDSGLPQIGSTCLEIEAGRGISGDRHWGKSLAWTKKEPQEILELFRNRGGLRCDVLQGGTLRTGMSLEILSGP